MKVRNLTSSVFVTIAAAVAPAVAQPHFGATGQEAREVLVFMAVEQGNGVELSSLVTTPLLGRLALEVKWPAAGAPDAFLVRRAEVLSTVGRPLEGATALGSAQEWRLVQGGKAGRVTMKGRSRGTQDSPADAEDTPRVPSSWASLAHLDLNGDGRLTAEDPEFHNLGLFTDANANGTIDDGELVGFADAGIVAVVLASDPSETGALERAEGAATPLVLVDLKN